MNNFSDSWQCIQEDGEDIPNALRLDYVYLMKIGSTFLLTKSSYPQSMSNQSQSRKVSDRGTCACLDTGSSTTSRRATSSRPLLWKRSPEIKIRHSAEAEKEKGAILLWQCSPFFACFCSAKSGIFVALNHPLLMHIPREIAPSVF